MKHYFLIVLVSCMNFMLPLAGHAQTADADASTFKNNQNLQRSRNAVVEITSKAIEDAPSARTLGQSRQGSGV